MKDIIDILLKKKETLEADREAEKALACERIDAQYAERSEKIEALLDMAGYVPAPEEVPEEAAADAEAVANVTEQAASENVEHQNAMQVY